MSERVALLEQTEDGILLCSPELGQWAGGPQVGALVGPGQPLGWITRLGRALPLVAPAGAVGRVVERPPPGAVDYGKPLLRLDPVDGAAAEAQATAAEAASGPVFVAPMSGRFYARPAPDRPPFLQVGDELEAGRTVCLLEVMKTFNRVSYGGPGLPPRARVQAILIEDGADVAQGQAILQIDPI